MNIKGILLAVVVLALTVGCTWAATEASGTAGFAVIPDNEAVQILGGVGRQCNVLYSSEDYYPCGYTEEDCNVWVYTYEVWQCGWAPSGECDDSAYVTGWRWGGCIWYPEVEGGVCGRDGTAEDVPVNACN
jgi:hypothetical protein